MPAVVVVGAQWGDEGKGKVVDLYAEGADVVVRYAGGANAGHTLVIDGKKLVTHLIPSGVLHPGKLCVLGDGMVIDPQTLLEEIAECKARGLLARDADLVVGGAPTSSCRTTSRSRRCARSARTPSAPPCAASARPTRPKPRAAGFASAISRTPSGCAPSSSKTSRSCAGHASLRRRRSRCRRHRRGGAGRGQQLARYVGDASATVATALADGRKVLFEGAQGALLDIDHGTYPYVTSSSTVAAGACLGAGIGPTRIDAVIGICKAYTTRVGGGPFPDRAGRRRGRRRCARRGASSARPPGGRAAAAGSTSPRCVTPRASTAWIGLALTKLDVLQGLAELKVCVGYELDGKAIDRVPIDAADLERVVPRYESFPGWSGETRNVGSFDELPGAAKDYVRAVEELSGVQTFLVSVGPDRNDTFSLREPFDG